MTNNKRNKVRNKVIHNKNFKIETLFLGYYFSKPEILYTTNNALFVRCLIAKPHQQKKGFLYKKKKETNKDTKQICINNFKS